MDHDEVEESIPTNVVDLEMEEDNEVEVDKPIIQNEGSHSKTKLEDRFVGFQGETGTSEFSSIVCSMADLSLERLQSNAEEVISVWNNRDFETFEDMHLKEDLLKGIKYYGYVMPSAVQKATIVPMCGKFDVFGFVSESKPGKTSAICIGILQKLDCTILKCQAVVFTLTSLMAEEYGKAMEQLGASLKVKVCVFDGVPSACPDGAHVFVGTLSRLMMDLSPSWTEHVKLVFFDKPEWIVNREFSYIFRCLLPRRENYNVCSFSEAEWQKVENFVRNWMRKPVLKISSPHLLESDEPEGSHQVIGVRYEAFKLNELKKLYNTSPRKTSVVFVESAQMVGKLVSEMKKLDSLEVLFTQKGMKQKTKDRKTQQLLQAEGPPRVLITTEEWANDMDLKQVGCVVNYDLPMLGPEHYLRRMRRCGQQVDCINFVSSSQWHMLFDIQNHNKGTVIFEVFPLQPNLVGPTGFSGEQLDIEGFEISKDKQLSPGITHILFQFVYEEAKPFIISKNLKEDLANVKTVIFSKDDHHKEIVEELEGKGFAVYAEDDMEGFFKCQAIYCVLLITKDQYACDHLHPKVPIVINYDLPLAAEIYDHRIAWCGENGVAFHFLTNDDWLRVFHFQSRESQRIVDLHRVGTDLDHIIQKACNAQSDYTYDWKAKLDRFTSDRNSMV